MKRLAIKSGTIAVVVCAVCVCVVGSSVSRVRSDTRLLQGKYETLVDYSTNLWMYAVRLERLEKAVADPSFRASPEVVMTSADYVGTVGSIPYQYFRAQGYKGIFDGRSRYLVVGQRSRYGVLTDCGRDYAEFDHSRIMGLDGVGHDSGTGGRTTANFGSSRVD